MWELSQNDGHAANVLMHIIYILQYTKKKRICIRIGSVGIYIYFGIRSIVKLLEKNMYICINSSFSILMQFSYANISQSIKTNQYAFLIHLE